MTAITLYKTTPIGSIWSKLPI